VKGSFGAEIILKTPFLYTNAVWIVWELLESVFPMITPALLIPFSSVQTVLSG
jgi:hypothetical protein